MDDLKQRGLLDTTLIVWMGEFGRTPQINAQRPRPLPQRLERGARRRRHQGRPGHRQDQRRTATVEDRPVTVTDLLATVCKALGVDPLKQNISNVGRPIRIVDKSAKPIHEILT